MTKKMNSRFHILTHSCLHIMSKTLITSLVLIALWLALFLFVFIEEKYSFNNLLLVFLGVEGFCIAARDPYGLWSSPIPMLAPMVWG